MKAPILVWDFYNSPKEFQELSGHGGDEDWVAFVPDGAPDPTWAWEGTPFGCFSVEDHKVEGGRVLIGAHS